MDLNSQNEEGETLILQAVKNGHVDVPGLYVDILETVELDKKLILAQAIHESFPTASPDSMGATTQYCELRYGIAMKLMEFSEGNSTAKQMTLACLHDVLHDPTAPKSRIQKFISNLTD